MLEQIQQLIADGSTEEALALLAQQSSDALLLQARYNAGKKQYNMGLIEFSEWQRTQAQINYAALELAKSVGRSSGSNTGQAGAGVPAIGSSGSSAIVAAPQAQPEVFISYNHEDSFAMRSVKSTLEENEIKVFVDFKDMGAGDDIQDFIDKAFKQNHFVVSLISRNSLLSGWVNKELSAAMLLNRMSSKWIPVSLDKSWIDPDFYPEAMTIIEGRITELKNRMKKALEDDHDTSPYEDDLKRQRSLKANLGTTLETLKKVLVVDISGPMFDGGTAKIVQAIKGAS